MDNTKFLKSVTQGYKNCSPLFGGEANVSLFPLTTQYLRARSLDPEFLSACGIVRCLTAEAQIDLHEYHPSAEVGDLIIPVWSVATGGALADVRLWRVRDGERRARFRGGDTIPGAVMANDAARLWLAGESVSRLVICEGEPDWCARVQLENNSAVIGIVNTTWNADLAAACDRAGEILLLVDDDTAGEQYYAKPIYRSLSAEAQARCRRYRAPEGVLDKQGKKPDQNSLLQLGLAEKLDEYCGPYAPAPEPERAPLTSTQIVASERKDWRATGDRGWILAKMCKWWWAKWDAVLTAAKAGGGTNAGKGGGGWTGLALPVLRAAAGWDSLRHELVTPEQVAMAGDGYLCLDLGQMERELIAAAKQGAEAAPKAQRSKTRGDRIRAIRGTSSEGGAVTGGIVQKAMKGPLGFEDFTRMHTEKREPKKTKTVTVSVGRTAGTTVTLEVEDRADAPPPPNPNEGAQMLSAAKRAVKNRRLIKTHFPTAPCHDNAKIPDGYEIREDGSIWREALGDDDRPSRDPVCTGPLIVIGAAIDQDGMHWREVAWLARDGGWGTAVIERVKLADRAAIVRELAPLDAPVNSTYAAQIVAYLDRYDTANAERLRRTRVANRMGWLDDGGFMLGSDIYVSPDGREIDAKNAAGEGVRYRPKDVGDAQEGRAFSRAVRGSYGDWLTAVEEIKKYPIAMYGLYASLAAPLVSLLEMQTPIIDWSAPTTAGKTSILMLAASVWGEPSESGGGADGRILKGWDQSAVSIERMAAGRCHLPIFLNDTKKISKRLDVPQTIFSLHEGTGQGRGSIAGLAGQAGWQSVVLSTGEQRLVDFAGATDGGVHARVVTIHAMPWGEKSSSKREEIDAFRFSLLKNYGHVGRKWVAWLAKNKSQTSKWQAKHLEIWERYAAATEGNEMAARMAKMAAVVTLAAQLADEALGWDLDGVAACDAVFAQILPRTRSRSVHEQALHDLWSYAATNDGQFWNDKNRGKDKPRDGWIGRWDHPTEHEARGCWSWIAIESRTLSVLLDRMGYKGAESIREMWDSHGWIDGSVEMRDGKEIKRSTRKHRIDGQGLPCVTFSRETLERLGIVEPLTPEEISAGKAAEGGAPPPARKFATPAKPPAKENPSTQKQKEGAPFSDPPPSTLSPDDPGYCPF